MALSASNANLQQELWRKQLFVDVRDNLYMTRFIGESEQSMIQELTDLKKEKGDNISFGLGMKLSGAGISGDSTLEGNEEAMTDYDEDVAIDQLRHAVRLTGRMDEKKNAYDMRMSAKNRLADWWAERIDQEILDKLCGKTTSTFANTPTVAAASRSVFAGGQSAVNAITTAMKIDTKVLDKAKQTAKLASPMIKPLRIGGKEYYVVILHPYDATNLRQDPVWNQAQREANVRGETNPIFDGSLGIYNGMVIHEHEYVYNTTDGSGSANVSRNLLCGQQSGVIAWGENVRWVEKSFDYGNSWGISCGAIFGAIKPIFNSVDYGVVTMFCAGAAASTA
ncbi:MAG: N4-gp56 family major capsid protein [Candidatus Riesia sp.]|nr:N4-gp56 family major capsid protein [Candidatus Riesia sp.]